MTFFGPAANSNTERAEEPIKRLCFRFRFDQSAARTRAHGSDSFTAVQSQQQQQLALATHSRKYGRAADVTSSWVGTVLFSAMNSTP